MSTDYFGTTFAIKYWKIDVILIEGLAFYKKKKEERRLQSKKLEKKNCPQSTHAKILEAVQ